MIERSALVCTVVDVALLVLLPVFGSAVPSVPTDAVFESTVPFGTDEASVTWIVIVRSPPAARPVVSTQVTSWPRRSSRPSYRPREGQAASSVSVMWKPPVLSDGPLLCTVTV